MNTKEIIIGSRVLACNIVKLNAEGTIFDSEKYYEEGIVVEIHEENVCDVQFSDGSLIKNAKISALKSLK